MRNEGSMTNSPSILFSLESARKLVGLVLKGRELEEGTLPLTSESIESVLEEYDGGGCHRNMFSGCMFRK